MKEIYFRGSKIFEFNDDNAIQIMGNKNYLIRVITEIYFKIFNGYRFSDLDIEAMNGYYPEVRQNGNTLKKNDIIVIKISEIGDILEQLTTKKNSVLIKYILSLSNDLSISKSVDKIDRALTELSISIDNLIKNKTSTVDLSIKTDIDNIDLDKIIKNFIDVNFISLDEERIPLWLLKDSEAVDLFINIIRLILDDGKKTRVIIDRLDSKIELKTYTKLIETLFVLTEEYSNFGIWIIPSTKKGVLVDYRIFSNTYIINEEIIKLGDFQVTYESICRNYPDNNIPTEKEVLKCLLQLFPFHTYEKEYLFTKEAIIMSVFLGLLGEEEAIEVKKDKLSKLEYKFLTSFD